MADMDYDRPPPTPALKRTSKPMARPLQSATGSPPPGKSLLAASPPQGKSLLANSPPQGKNLLANSPRPRAATENAPFATSQKFNPASAPPAGKSLLAESPRNGVPPPPPPDPSLHQDAKPMDRNGLCSAILTCSVDQMAPRGAYDFRIPKRERPRDLGRRRVPVHHGQIGSRGHGRGTRGNPRNEH